MKRKKGELGHAGQMQIKPFAGLRLIPEEQKGGHVSGSFGFMFQELFVSKSQTDTHHSF